MDSHPGEATLAQVVQIATLHESACKTSKFLNAEPTGAHGMVAASVSSADKRGQEDYKDRDPAAVPHVTRNAVPAESQDTTWAPVWKQLNVPRAIPKLRDYQPSVLAVLAESSSSSSSSSSNLHHLITEPEGTRLSYSHPT